MKKILMMTTGGTIAALPTEHGLMPGLRADQLLEELDELRENCTIDTLEVCSLDSTNMTSEYWLKLAALIGEHYREYDGFVICHGTDTMAYTAAALSYLVQRLGKPVVLTGSQRPAGQRISDAGRNLRDAITVAADARCRGVQIVFNGQIIAGTRAKKVKSFSFDAFTSINFPLLGLVQNGRVIRYLEEPVPEGDLLVYRQMDPKVFLLKLTPGMQPQILEAIFGEFDCIIVESFGVGGIPDSLVDEFFRLLTIHEKEGKLLIMTTQVTYEGSDVDIYEVGRRIRERFRFLEAYDMTLEAVLTKIMWILGMGVRNFDEIEKLFYTRVQFDSNAPRAGGDGV